MDLIVNDINVINGLNTDQRQLLIQNKIDLENGIINKDISLINKSINVYKKIHTTIKHKYIITGINRGLTALCSMSPDNSITYLLEALRYDSNDACIYNNLGFVRHKQYNDVNEAIKNYKRCLELDPKYIHAYLGLIDIYNKLRLLKECEYYINIGLKEIPNNADLLNIKGLHVLNTTIAFYETLDLFKKGLKALKIVDTELYKCPHKSCNTSTATKKCSGCNSVYYCSQEHQKEDWSRHKITCKKILNRSLSSEKDPDPAESRRWCESPCYCRGDRRHTCW